MKRKVCCLFDSKLGTFRQPFLVEKIGEAERALEYWANDPKSDLYRYPDEYSLYEIGKFDVDKGIMENLGQHRLIGVARQYRKPAPEQVSLVQ